MMTRIDEFFDGAFELADKFVDRVFRRRRKLKLLARLLCYAPLFALAAIPMCIQVLFSKELPFTTELDEIHSREESCGRGS